MKVDASRYIPGTEVLKLVLEGDRLGDGDTIYRR